MSLVLVWRFPRKGWLESVESPDATVATGSPGGGAKTSARAPLRDTDGHVIPADYSADSHTGHLQHGDRSACPTIGDSPRFIHVYDETSSLNRRMRGPTKLATNPKMVHTNGKGTVSS